MSYDFSENDSRKHEDFISAVCWSDVNIKPLFNFISVISINSLNFKQNYVLAANSQGIVKVLELEEYSQ
jgi:hypothetical protein